MDPFSDTQPGREAFEDDEDENASSSSNPDNTKNEDDNQFIIYIDVKTGRIGKIACSACREQKFIVDNDDHDGNEVLQGKIHDNAEKEQLIWDLKKTMKIIHRALKRERRHRKC